MGQRHVCTFRHAQRAAYRTAISAAQTCYYYYHHHHHHHRWTRGEWWVKWFSPLLSVSRIAYESEQSFQSTMSSVAVADQPDYLPFCSCLQSLSFLCFTTLFFTVLYSLVVFLLAILPSSKFQFSVSCNILTERLRTCVTSDAVVCRQFGSMQQASADTSILILVFMLRYSILIVYSLTLFSLSDWSA